MRMPLEPMIEAAAEFPQHLRDGLGATAKLNLPDGPFSAVALIGMGGSSIGGALAGALLEARAQVPISLVRDHTLPGFVDDQTLVIATSYSGGTAETLDATQDALHRGASVVAVTTGGRLGYMAEQAGAAAVPVPSGYQPRAALGWLFAANYGILCRSLDVGSTEAVLSAADALEAKVDGWADPDGPAAYMASQMDDGTVGVVGHDLLGMVARRWAAQLNENAKRLAFHETLPEAAHNQVVGWLGKAGNATLMLLRRSSEAPYEAARMSYLADQADNSDGPVVQARVGGGRIQEVLEAVLLGDYVSLHLARMEGVDPEPVDAIQGLKRKLRDFS